MRFTAPAVVGSSPVQRGLFDGRRTRRNPRVRVPEHVEQVALMQWAALSLTRYPDLAWLYAIPNGGHRYANVAKALKAEGVKSGVSDLHLPVAKRGYHGLWIEMKAAGGQVSSAQRAWLEGMRMLGHRAEMCRGFEAARTVLEDYLRED